MLIFWGSILAVIFGLHTLNKKHDHNGDAELALVFVIDPIIIGVGLVVTCIWWLLK